MDLLGLAGILVPKKIEIESPKGVAFFLPGHHHPAKISTNPY